MKKLKFHKQFKKDFNKLNRKQQEKVKTALKTYLIDLTNKSLRYHALTGEYKGQVSISAGGDLRIHLLETENEIIVIVLRVGTHSQLYK